MTVILHWDGENAPEDAAEFQALHARLRDAGLWEFEITALVDLIKTATTSTDEEGSGDG